MVRRDRPARLVAMRSGSRCSSTDPRGRATKASGASADFDWGAAESVPDDERTQPRPARADLRRHPSRALALHRALRAAAPAQRVLRVARRAGQFARPPDRPRRPRLRRHARVPGGVRGGGVLPAARRGGRSLRTGRARARGCASNRRCRRFRTSWPIPPSPSSGGHRRGSRPRPRMQRPSAASRPGPTCCAARG